MDRVWLTQYDPGVPGTLSYPDIALPDLLTRAAERYPDRPALRFYGRVIRYRELDALATRFAHALMNQPIRKGGVVGLMLPNLPQTVIGYYGSLRAGAIVTPVNPLFVESEIAHQVSDSGCETILALDQFYPRLKPLLGRTCLKRVILTGVADYLPWLKRLLYPLKTRGQGRYGPTSVSPAVSTLQQCLSDPPGFPPVPISRDDVALLQYTGGTTGIPKGVVLTHQNLERYDLRSVRLCISGAGPLHSSVQDRFEALTGARLVEGYGLTEAGPVTHVNLTGPDSRERRRRSIGLPLPDTDAKIMDIETGERELRIGEIGELAVRGPQVMPGYWKRDDETRHVLRNDWLFTGDLARMDASGFFYIEDRKKDMIKSGGENVYPREVEEVLVRHPKIKEAVVAGIPQGLRGELIKAYVVLKDGEHATVADILDHCRHDLAKFKVPKKVEFSAELPKTLVGKVLRRVLVEEELKKDGPGQDP